jgi:hypothetical protein
VHDAYCCWGMLTSSGPPTSYETSMSQVTSPSNKGVSVGSDGEGGICDMH